MEGVRLVRTEDSGIGRRTLQDVVHAGSSEDAARESGSVTGGGDACPAVTNASFRRLGQKARLQQ